MKSSMWDNPRAFKILNVSFILVAPSTTAKTQKNNKFYILILYTRCMTFISNVNNLQSMWEVHSFLSNKGVLGAMAA